MRKKLLCCLLFASVILPLNACGNNDAAHSTPEPTATATKKPEFNMQEFKILVAEYNADLMKQSVLIGNMEP